MPSIKHLHIYERSKPKHVKPQIFRCVDPDCSHYTTREFLIGKRSRCIQCGTEFILDLVQLANKKPKCINCSDTKESKVKKASRSIMEELFHVE
jgi:formylmethanofuran dehydrogenase subunit E